MAEEGLLLGLDLLSLELVSIALGHVLHLGLGRLYLLRGSSIVVDLVLGR